MSHDVLYDGTILLDRTVARDLDAIREAQSELAEWRLRGHVTVHVAGALAEEFNRDDLDAIGRRAVRLNIGTLIAVGSRARVLHLAAEHEGSWDGESLPVADIDSAYDELTRLRGDGVVVLVTGSHDVVLSELVDRLKEAA
jgi:UDP-N-acetylmuramoyl-tripeptide--D-alanyl-D-alanine ligase